VITNLGSPNKPCNGYFIRHHLSKSEAILNSENKEIWIGTISIGLLVCVLGMISHFQSPGLQAPATQIRIIAKFNKVDGLSEGSAVRMGGVHVGRVNKMQLDKSFRAVITMDIDNKYPYPMDTSAAIHTDGLFGGKFIVLEPGAEENILNNEDEISLTQDAIIVSDLLELIISEGKVVKDKHQNANDKSN
jgi:phospholipid/cholesterol/gamma-HCH transport system substrate-binding protein